MSLITQVEWARRQGFSKQYVGKLINEGKIKLVKGMIDERTANAALEMQRNPNISLKRNGSGIYEQTSEINALFAKTRLKNEIEKGKLLEAKVKSEIGELVSAEEVRKTAFAMGRIIRDGILNVPDRVSALLATINDASQIHEILTKELRLVLEELSNDDDAESI